MNILPDDPKITAYALGELEGEARAEVEAAIAADDQLRKAVEQIRLAGAQLTTAFAAELGGTASVPSVFKAAAIVPGRDFRVLDGGKYGQRRNTLSFPQMYYVIAGLAAACFALLIAVRQPSFSPKSKSAPGEEAELLNNRTIELPLASTEPAVKLSVPTTGSVVIQVPAENEAPPAAPTPAVPTLAATAPRPEVSGEILAPADAANLNSAVLQAALPQEPVVMNPFMLTTQQDKGFQSMSVGSGSRLRIDLADTPVAYSVVNREFIEALGIVEQARPAGRAGGGGGGGRGGATGPLFSSSQAAAGGQAGTQRNFYTNSNTTNDSFAVETYDFGRGPNSAQFGNSSGLAGVSSTQTQQARLTGWDGSTAFRGPSREAVGSESYAATRTNQFINVADQEMSTFSIDVDSASYANVRRFIDSGQLPPRDAVRVEELVNYFPYKYAAPSGNLPFGTTMEAASAPWDSEHRLVRIAIKGRDIAAAARPRANLVFLLDVSGSMNEPNKLPLVKDSMRLLLRRLREDDRVAIVVYAGDSGVALRPTPASRSAEIASAIDSLRAGGSTNGASGIRLAYDLAQENFVQGGINRVILCTDGDFNVGVTSQGDLTRLIEERAKSNVFLTVLGFGMGNLKDSTLELLADKGNGNYGYIDSRREAEKLLVEQITSTLVTIAKDVKIQVVFNPAQVAAYRLIGYENRLLAAQDFNNDKVDAGEIGAGHTVTALYEVVLANSDAGGTVDPSPYRVAQDEARRAEAAKAAAEGRQPRNLAQQLRDRELFTLRIRYKEPTGETSRLQEFPFTDSDGQFIGASEDFRFATAVAAFGMTLRTDKPQPGVLTQAIAWAENSLGADTGGYRREFVDLARRARSLIR